MWQRQVLLLQVVGMRYGVVGVWQSQVLLLQVVEVRCGVVGVWQSQVLLLQVVRAWHQYVLLQQVVGESRKV